MTHGGGPPLVTRALREDHQRRLGGVDGVHLPTPEGAAGDDGGAHDVGSHFGQW